MPKPLLSNLSRRQVDTTPAPTSDIVSPLVFNVVLGAILLSVVALLVSFANRQLRRREDAEKTPEEGKTKVEEMDDQLLRSSVRKLPFWPVLLARYEAMKGFKWAIELLWKISLDDMEKTVGGDAVSVSIRFVDLFDYSRLTSVSFCSSSFSSARPSSSFSF